MHPVVIPEVFPGWNLHELIYYILYIGGNKQTYLSAICVHSLNIVWALASFEAISLILNPT